MLTKIHQQRKALEEAEGSTAPEENGMQERGRGGDGSPGQSTRGKKTLAENFKGKENKHDEYSNGTILKKLGPLESAQS